MEQTLLAIYNYATNKLLDLGSINRNSLRKLLHDDPGISFSITSDGFSKLRELIAKKLGEMNPAIILTKKGKSYYFVEKE
eukprot:scaffold73191_cov22-Cyclotella_meneghiniana.AAC.2